MQCGLNGSDVLAGSEGSGIEMPRSFTGREQTVPIVLKRQTRVMFFFCILADCERHPLMRAGSGQTVSPTPGAEMIVFLWPPICWRRVPAWSASGVWAAKW